MTDNSPKAVVARLWGIYNDEGLMKIPDMFADDGAWNYASAGPRAVGKAAMRARVEGMRAAFRDIGITVHRSVAEGDTVASRWTWRGTFRVPFGRRRARWMDGASSTRADGVLVESRTWAAGTPDEEPNSP
ncbi:MAG: ester cyclase [Dehalococcoidia bacterium]|uniref:ester cyclase n=1 Tax=Candidatus Amarobacter glycogenicus TaxID=3140699 RepID=UPI003136C87F|nr:ester cyclase [Dehalococcoidia bacterium]